MCVLRQAPEGCDSDVWQDLMELDLAAHLHRVEASVELDDQAIRDFVARRVMERLDLSRPPFKIDILDRLEGDRCALFIRMHHAVADGIGFQSVLDLLSDATAPAPPRASAAVLSSPEVWRERSTARFEAEAALREEQALRRRDAVTALKAMGAAGVRPATPILKLSGPTSGRRNFATTSFPLQRLKRIAKALDATINDLFLAMASTALRNYLIAVDDLPDSPIVVNSARSYRRPEHGRFGNRIVALHPHLATHLPDPLERLRSIQASMASEMARTTLDESLLDQAETPFGARDRRQKFANRTASGGAVLPGNVTLSNVPGPAEARSFAGFRQLANFPAPLLGSGRFLNITSRRNGPNLDMGVMTDAEKIADATAIAPRLGDALETYETLAAEFQTRR